MDAVRREADACDHMEGFQLVHSMGGGTGSGLGSRVIERLSDEYNGKMTQSFSVYPSEKVSDCLVEPYNAVFMQ
jgi:tubulin beta